MAMDDTTTLLLVAGGVGQPAPPEGAPVPAANGIGSYVSNWS